MISLENYEIFNFENAFRGLRNPLNSWDKSDSKFGIEPIEQYLDHTAHEFFQEQYDAIKNEDPFLVDHYFNTLDRGIIKKSADEQFCEYALLGKKDINLAQRMIKGGTDENKFLR